MSGEDDLVRLGDVLSLFREDATIHAGRHCGWYPDDVIRVAYGLKPAHTLAGGVTPRHRQRRRVVSRAEDKP